jgi:CRISPR-associated endonuclease Csn1
MTVQRILGLDIGIASVGFALVELDDSVAQTHGSLIRSGVRLFDRAEEPKTGASLALPRRMARASRRVIRRRAGRMNAIRALFMTHGLAFYPDRLTDDHKKAMSAQSSEKTPWQLRAEGLERQLSQHELARALYHIGKHRGFKSTKKGETTDKEGKESETGKLLKAAKAIQESFKASGYRTAGEFFYATKLQKGQKVRNGNGTYDNSILRLLNQQEVTALFEAQRGFGATWATEALQEEFDHVFFHQAPLKSVEGMVGKCELEAGLPRAPRFSRSAELFILWQKINHLRIKPKLGSMSELTPEQRQTLYDLAHKNKEVTYTQARKALAMAVDEIFQGLNYTWPRKEYTKLSEADRKDLGKLIKHVEKAKFVQLPGYYAMHTIMGEQPNDALWDEVARILSFEQDVLKIKQALSVLPGLTELQCEQLALIAHFKGTVGHSAKAIQNMLPHLQAGLTYDKAKVAAGYAIKSPKGTLNHLPPFGKTNNPVVDRALAQTRKVVNALIREYGMPERIHVEMGRDTANSFEERMKIQRQQKENEEENQKADKAITEELGQRISRLKYRLWQQQHRTCLYSGLPIKPEQLVDDLATQIDHALPYSRSFDNSFNNKVLVLTEENQTKRNRTVWEYFSQEKPPEAWEELQSMVSHMPRAKQDKILMQDFDAETENSFKERNLNDMRWAARTLKNHLEQHLAVNKVMTINGALTANLRQAWGLEGFKKDKNGNRVDNARHHAIDAVAIACATQRMVQIAAQHNRLAGRKHLAQTGDKSLLFAQKPWPHFRHDVENLIVNNPHFFVSRMPRRKMTGEIASPNPKKLAIQPETGKQVVINRLALTDLNEKKLENLIDRHTHNACMYQALKNQLTLHGNDGKKAFKDGVFTYQDAKGNPHTVYKVACWGSPESGQHIRGGLVSNGEQIRVDVFKQDHKFYLCVVYASHVIAGKLPREICSREEPKPVLDDTYDFVFSLYPNDFVEINDGKNTYAGYYVGSHITLAQVYLRSHDGAGLYPKKEKGVETLVSERNFGVMTLKSFKKFQVDVLGNRSEITGEPRHELANGTNAAARQAKPAPQSTGVPK